MLDGEGCHREHPSALTSLLSTDPKMIYLALVVSSIPEQSPTPVYIGPQVIEGVGDDVDSGDEAFPSTNRILRDVKPVPPAFDAQGHLVGVPVWKRRPTRAEIRNVYPSTAAADGIGGLAQVFCIVEPDNTLSGCDAVDPKGGYGFGKAALSLTASFRIQPGTVDGRPIAKGMVRIPIRFDPPAQTKPVGVLWVSSPRPANIRAVTTRYRLRSAAGGVGVMRCTVTGDTLNDCRPVGEMTALFSRAAVELAPQFNIYKNFANGRPTDGTIFNIPVIFDGLGATPPIPVLDNPVRFIRAPTNAQKNAVFPAAAKARGVTTIAVSESCVVSPDGSLAGCRTTKEDPVGVGGAEAAIRLVNAFQLPTWTAEGRPVAGAAVKVDIVWAPPTMAAGFTPLAALGQSEAPAAAPASSAKARTKKR